MGRTYVAIVLDRSGSMGTVRNETVNGLNETIQAIQEEALEGEWYLSLVTFATTVTADFFNVPVGQVKTLSLEDYHPNGWTAFRDGLGYTIERLCAETNIDDPENAYRVYCLTDGQENKSQRFTEAQIAEKIATLEAKPNWTFSVIGANIDLKQLRGWGFTASNMASYESTDRGTTAAFKASADSMRSYAKSRSKGMLKVSNLYSESDDIGEIKS